MNKHELYGRLCKQGHFEIAQKFFDQIELDEADHLVDDEDYEILEEAREKDPNKLSQRQIDELFKEQERGNKK